MKKIYSIFVLAMLAVLIFSFSLLTMERTRTLAGDLVSQEVATAPTVDGIIDDIWAEATALVVPLGETANPPDDPSKIGNCAGCHAYDSEIQVTLKAVHTTDRIFVLATWPDTTASFTRGGSWSYATGAWAKPNSIQSEDRFSLFWPMGEITGDPYSTGGCMTKCHMYYPTDTDPHVSTHGIVDDAWLTSGRADMWHSKAARSDAYLSATGTGLTIDAATHQITAGTYSALGYADDKYVDVWMHDSVNGEDGGRYGDAGKSAYSHNRIGDKSRPKYMETAPVDFADAMFLTQDEIDAAEVVGDPTTGVSDADAATYWPQYLALNAIVPERILRQPEGSRGDLDLGTNWTDGIWTVEFSRELLNGNDDDVQFDILSEYLFNVAQFDNSRHGYEHRTSANFMMSFMNTGIEEAAFVGSDACKTCHSEKYNTWIESGHPYKFTVIENGEAPVYPPEAINFQEQYMDSLGDGSHTWSDIAGVIGGYGWKARFVGTDGFIVGTTGSAFSSGLGHNQMNFYGGEDHGWVNYDVSVENKVYNYGCFKCHTTGGDTTGTWLAGVDGLGTFTEEGIGCESCHGPGSLHIAGPTADNIDKVYEFAHQDNSLGGLSVDGVVQTPNPDSDDVNFLCGTCHNRSYTNPINSSGGFIKHHEQWDEMMSTKHGESLTCVTCHDPHKRTIWDGDGITKNCSECHSEQAAIMNHSAGVTCLDCHMPFAAKSGTKRGMSGYKADIRSHIVAIATDTESMFNEDGSAVRDDETRSAMLSPAYSCLGCHNDDPDDNIPEKTLEAAAVSAKGMHSATYIAPVNDLMLGIYPNPSSGPTRISVNLPENSRVDLSIYNASGQVIYAANGKAYPQGKQVILWDGKSNSGENVKPGYYFIKISAGGLTSVDKLVLMQ